MIGLDAVAVGRDVILNVNESVENAFITDSTGISTHLVALAISFSTRAERPDSVTTSCLEQNILTCSEVTRAVGRSKCVTRT